MARIMAIGVALLMTGCAASLERASAGHTGCLETDIVISNDTGKPIFNTGRSWQAECHGKKFVCSAYASGRDGAENISCTPRVE